MCFISSLSGAIMYILLVFFFFFIDRATTEIYTLSLHDALPISYRRVGRVPDFLGRQVSATGQRKQQRYAGGDEPALPPGHPPDQPGDSASQRPQRVDGRAPRHPVRNPQER